MLPPLETARPRIFLLLWVCLSLTAGACRSAPEEGAQPTDEGPRSGGTVVIGTSVDIEGVNELVSSTSNFTQDVIERMFLRLLAEQPDYEEHPPTMAPRLAESYSWSEDHKALTFRLRRDARWSDGTPITAGDVVWTWQAQTSPQVAWSYAQSKEGISEVEAIDAHTVRFHFQEPYAAQLLDANEGVILPRHAWSRLPFAEWRASGDWFRENLVVSGPFLLESWKPQEEIVLRRNEAYFELGLPRLDRVVFRVIPERANQITQALAGTLDFVDQLPPFRAAAIERAPGLRLISFWHRQYTYLCWNVANPLFAEAAVRRALTMAIDRQALVDALWFGRARISDSPILRSIWAHNDDLEPWPYDPAEARRILAEHGWQDGDGDGVLERGGRRFTFEIITNADNQERMDAAVMIQEQLRRVGIDVRARTMEFNTVIGRSLEHDFDAMIGGWAIDTSLDLKYAFHSQAIDDGYNFGGYSNPKMDRLIDEARRQTDPEAMRIRLHRIQEILHHDQPYTFLWEPQRLAAISERVQDARPNPLFTLFNLREWWIKPAA